MRLLAVPRRVEIGAAGQHQPVEDSEHLGGVGGERRDEDDGPPAASTWRT